MTKFDSKGSKQRAFDFISFKCIILVYRMTQKMAVAVEALLNSLTWEKWVNNTKDSNLFTSAISLNHENDLKM